MLASEADTFKSLDLKERKGTGLDKPPSKFVQSKARALETIGTSIVQIRSIRTSDPKQIIHAQEVYIKRPS